MKQVCVLLLYRDCCDSTLVVLHVQLAVIVYLNLLLGTRRREGYVDLCAGRYLLQQGCCYNAMAAHDQHTHLHGEVVHNTASV